MPYNFSYSSKWRKHYNVLEKEMQERANGALAKIADDPYIGKSLGGNLAGLRSFRIGQYRLLYEISEKEKLVLLVTIGLRKNVYDLA